MPLQFIDNQPIRFNSAKFDDQACINKDLSAYALLVQPDDPICFQMKQSCCDENLACEADTVGAELVTDGDMSNAAAFTLGAGWAIASGVATYTAGVITSLSQVIAITVGRPYKVTMDVVSNDTLFGLYIFLGNRRIGIIEANQIGAFTFYGVSGETTASISIFTAFDYAAPTTGTAVIDNLSVKPLAECYTFDTSTKEYVVNGTFTGSSSPWFLGSGWTWNAGNFVRHTTPASLIPVDQLLVGIEHRHNILFTITITNRTVGGIDYQYGGVTMQSITASASFNYPANGIGNNFISLDPTGGFDGDIDTISATEIQSGWIFTPDGGFCHTQGWTNAFYASNTLVIGNFYKMSIQVSMNEGSLLVEAGGVVLGTITEDGNYDYFFTALTTSGEKFTPSDEFDGCVFPSISICPQLTKNNIELRLVYDTGEGATDWHTNLSATNPIMYNEDWITWCITSLDDVLSGGIQVALPESCYRMQVRFLDCSGTPIQLTSDTLINYKEVHSCTKRIRAWSNYIADGFNFGDNGNIFKLIQRFRTLYFNPSYPNSGEDYKHWTGTKKRTYSEREKHYEVLFDYMDEYAHDTMSIMIVSDIFEMDGIEYNVPFKDYEPDWAERGKRNLSQSRIEITKRIEGVLFNRNCR